MLHIENIPTNKKNKKETNKKITEGDKKEEDKCDGEMSHNNTVAHWEYSNKKTITSRKETNKKKRGEKNKKKNRNKERDQETKTRKSMGDKKRK